MQLGIHAFTRGPTSTPAQLQAYAKGCEALRYSYFGLNDHVVLTAQIDSAYPYTKDGSWAGANDTACLDLLTVHAYIAAVTERIRLLTSVMVIPHRPAVLTAKMLTTLDVLAQGRLTVGTGVGWMCEEITALSDVPFEKRGAVSREYLQAWRCLWTEPVASYQGEYVQFENVIAEPKPIQRPGPPIWVGGEGPAARRRAATLGDGWYPVAANPQHPLNSPALFAAALADVHARMDAAGRERTRLETALFAPWARVGKPSMVDGQRMVFTGSRQAVADDIAAFDEAGVGTLVVAPAGDDVDEMLEHGAGFADIAGL
jgi:probable F420-dependent oxidoreductase